MSVWNKKRRVMRHYDQSARVYDAQYFEEQEAKIKTAMDNLTLNEGSVILDAGCGTGLLLKHITEKSKLTVCADISNGILKEAKKKARNYRNVSVLRADADNMPFSNHAFDYVFAITLLQNTPNSKVTLNEIKRISKSNAKIVVTGLKKAFTLDEFRKALKRANLKTAIITLDEQRRESVAICTKTIDES